MGKPLHVVALLATGSRGEGIDFYLLPGKAFEQLPKQPNGKPGFVGTDENVLKLPPGSVAPLRDNLIPTLVTFMDLNDPKTARVVPPDDFAQVFGPGFRLRDATLEILSSGTWPLTLFGISGTPLTRSIEMQLPKIILQLRERARVMQVHKVGDPYSTGLGDLRRD